MYIPHISKNSALKCPLIPAFPQTGLFLFSVRYTLPPAGQSTELHRIHSGVSSITTLKIYQITKIYIKRTDSGFRLGV